MHFAIYLHTDEHQPERLQLCNDIQNFGGIKVKKTYEKRTDHLIESSNSIVNQEPTPKSILHEQDLKFHGIGHNLFKIIGILEHGILTPKDSNKSDLYSTNYFSFEKENVVPVVESPSISNNNCLAYKKYVEVGISFIIKGLSNKRLDNKNYNMISEDENFYNGSISQNNIFGIVLSSRIQNKPISSLRILNYVGYAYAENTCNKIIQYMSKNIELDTVALYNWINKKEELIQDDTIKSKDKRIRIKEITEQIDTLLSLHIEEYFKKIMNQESITVKDAVNFLTQGKIVLFDEQGYLIK